MLHIEEDKEEEDTDSDVESKDSDFSIGFDGIQISDLMI